MNRKRGKFIQLVAMIVATVSVTALALCLWQGMPMWLVEVFAALGIIGLWVNAIMAVLAYVAQKYGRKSTERRETECTQNRN